MAPPAGAYVLQGPHIFELMIEKLGQAEGFAAFQKVIFYRTPPPAAPAVPEAAAVAGNTETAAAAGTPGSDTQPAGPAPEPQVVELNGSARYLFSKAFRSDITTGDNRRVYVYAGGQSLTIIDGVQAARPESRFDLYKDLLLFRSRPALVDRMALLGVDVSVSSLGRFEGQPAFVVGAQYPDLAAPQVWVDKETFLPLRWIVSSGSGEYSPDVFEIRYHRWRQIGPMQYPMDIEFFQGGKLVRAIRVEHYALNPEFDPQLFDIDHLRAVYPPAASNAGGEENAAGASEVQKTIEEFKKIFE